MSIAPPVDHVDVNNKLEVRTTRQPTSRNNSIMDKLSMVE
jgi:hypothetical protein